ncbi:hypothetical protein AC249_AIPGENE7945 [Exaiptasia diaphana]|nr:hypothetical protein AC249_AIPGENE7945 [Exaiptasia diaphana]
MNTELAAQIKDDNTLLIEDVEDGESTILGPEPLQNPPQSPPLLPPPYSKAREKTDLQNRTTPGKPKELPPIKTVHSKSLSPYNSSMMPLVLERMKAYNKNEKQRRRRMGGGGRGGTRLLGVFCSHGKNDI